MTRLLSLSRAMFLAFRRDRAAIFFTIGFPLMFLVLFGGIFKGAGTPKLDVLEVGSVPLVDSVSGSDRAALTDILKLTPIDDAGAAREKVRQGSFDAAIAQQGDQVTVYFSSADQVKAQTVRSIVGQLVQATAGAPAVRLNAVQVEDTSLQPIQYYTPGLLGWSLAAGGTAGAALTLVGWRQKQLLRRLRLSPTPTITILGARVLVSVVIGLIQTALFLAVASLPYFGLKLSGAWWMAVPLVFAGTAAFLSIGLVIGAFARSEDAAQGLVQLIVLPMAFLSGAFFPLDAAPSWLRTVARFLPLHYLVASLQDVLVRGKGPMAAVPALIGLLAFAAVLAGLARLLFRWDEV